MSRLTDDDVLTVKEAAKLLRIGRNALYDAIGRGEVPYLRIGKTFACPAPQFCDR